MKRLTDRVDKLFAEWDRPDSPGCAIGIIQDGELVYKRGYGMADLDSGLPLTSKSAFDIQSVTKQFTAACITLLAQQGSISLDDDVRRYVPELPDYGTPIRVRHLLHHTGGLRDWIDLAMLAGRDFRDHFTRKDALEIIVSQRGLNYEPGARYLYGNSGYILLTETVERVSGASFGDFAETQILRPLGMNDSYMVELVPATASHQVKGYDPEEGGGYRRDPTDFQVAGDGGLVSTVEDLYLWDQGLHGNKLGDSGFLDTMLTRGTLDSGEAIDYAFGLVLGEYKGLETVHHGGDWVGVSTDMIRFPQQRFTAICLANLGTVGATRLTRRIADIYLEGHFRLEEYLGNYYNQELDGTHELVLRGSEIFLRHADGGEEPLGAVRGDKFKLMDSDARFVRDDGGRITGFTCSTERVKDIFFARKG